VTRPAYHGPHDDAIRGLVARDLTRHEIAQELGIHFAAVVRVLTRLKITTSEAAQLRKIREGSQRAAANRTAAAAARKPPREPTAPRRDRNPRLSDAQQAMVDGIKERSWHSRQCSAIPPPSREEADALIAAHIAQHGITQCPPAARIDGLTWLSVTPFFGGGGGYGGLAQRRARR
jgi:hypothetical protein